MGALLALPPQVSVFGRLLQCVNCRNLILARGYDLQVLCGSRIRPRDVRCSQTWHREELRCTANGLWDAARRELGRTLTLAPWRLQPASTDLGAEPADTCSPLSRNSLGSPCNWGASPPPKASPDRFERRSHSLRHGQPAHDEGSVLAPPCGTYA